MKHNSTGNFVSFLTGSLLSLFLITLVGYLVVFFWVYQYSYEPAINLADILNGYFLLFCLGLLLLITYFFTRDRFPFFSKGLLIGFLPVLVAFGLNTYNLYGHFKSISFNSKEWKQAEPKPYAMAKSIVRENLLIGKTKEEVKILLGEDHSVTFPAYVNDTTLAYRMDRCAFSLFVVRFDNRKKVKTVGYAYNN